MSVRLSTRGVGAPRVTLVGRRTVAPRPSNLTIAPLKPSRVADDGRHWPPLATDMREACAVGVRTAPMTLTVTSWW